MSKSDNSQCKQNLDLIQGRRDIAHLSEKRTFAIEQTANYSWFLKVSAIHIIDRLQQRILMDTNETSDPCKALAKVYQELPEELKIAFLLAGGAEQLFQLQQQAQRQNQRHRTDDLSSENTGGETGTLPVLC